MKGFGIYQSLIFRKATSADVIALLEANMLNLNSPLFSFSDDRWIRVGDFFSDYSCDIATVLFYPLNCSKFYILQELMHPYQFKGPFEIQDLLFLINSDKVGPFDLIFNPSVKAWVFVNTLFANFISQSSDEVLGLPDKDIIFSEDLALTARVDAAFNNQFYFKQDSYNYHFEVENIFSFSELSSTSDKLMDSLRDQNRELTEEVSELKKQNILIEKNIKKLGVKIKESHSEARIKIDQKDQDISSLKDNIVSIQKEIIKRDKQLKKINKAKEIIKETQLKQIDSSSKDDHLWFEIGDEKEWVLSKDEKHLTKAYSFYEIHTMFSEGKLNDENLKIKKLSRKSWKVLREHHYLALEIRIREELNGNQKIELKRLSSRIPFEGRVVVSTKKEPVYGNCSDISVGGCFVDMTKEHAQSFFKNEIIKFQITSPLMEGVFDLEGEVMNICMSRNSGLQIKFINASEKFSIDVDQLIKRHFAYIKKNAA